MSADPRMHLPEWLRDGDTPLPTPVESVAVEEVPAPVKAVVELAAAEDVVPETEPIVVPVTPYSDRLSLDTRLDPAQLVTADDLPLWLGGLERTATLDADMVDAQVPLAVTASAPSVMIEEPEPYEGVDAPEDGVVDVSVNGWYVVVAAIGLLILLAAALRLYLT